MTWLALQVSQQTKATVVFVIAWSIQTSSHRTALTKKMLLKLFAAGNSRVLKI
jgi:hypothetical protein